MDAINAFIAANLPLLGVIGTFAGVFTYWRLGGNGVQRSIIENFRTRVEQLEKDVIRLTKADTEKGTEIGRLNGIIGEKDNRIKMLEDLVTNRNPEMEKFFTFMKESTIRSEERDAKTTAVMTKIEKFMESMVKQSQRHEKKTDQQTHLLKAVRTTKS